MAYIVEIRGTKALESHLRFIARKLQIGKEELLDRWAEEVKSQFRGNAPRSTGALAESIEIKNDSPGTRTVGPTYEPAGYAAAVDTGNIPHWPAWSYSLKFNRKTIGQRFGIDKNTSFLIARKISQQAGKSHFGFARKTYIQAMGLFERIVQQFVTQIVKTV